jgi:hypothetical protein
MVERMESTLAGRQEERSGLSLRACGLGALEGEEREMLSPSLVHGNADPHAHQVHRRPVDRRQRGEVTLSLARVISLYLSLLGGEKLLV